ncbi:unnamed protein product, partial [Musa textilis]
MCRSNYDKDEDVKRNKGSKSSAMDHWEFECSMEVGRFIGSVAGTGRERVGVNPLTRSRGHWALVWAKVF